MSTQKPKAAKKAGRVIVDIPDTGGEWREEKQPDESIDSDDLAMEEAVRGLAEGERYLKLYRVNEQGGRPRFLAHLIPEEFNEGYVAERFGGGRYFARWKMTTGAWKRYPFEIEGEPFPVQRAMPGVKEEVIEEEETGPRYMPHYNPEGNGQTFSLRDMLVFMQQAEDRSFRQLQLMLQLSRPSQTQAPTEQVFSLIEKLAPMLQGGGEGGGNPWLIALNQLKEPLTKLVDSVQLAMVAKGAAIQPVAATVAGAQPATAPKVEAGKENPDMLVYIKQVLPMLVNAAAKNADPQTYADMLLDQLPTLGYAPLKEWLIKPGCLDTLAKIEPGIRYQAEWWESLRAAIIEALEEGGTDEPRPVQPNEATGPSTGGATAGGAILDAGERAGN